MISVGAGSRYTKGRSYYGHYAPVEVKYLRHLYSRLTGRAVLLVLP